MNFNYWTIVEMRMPKMQLVTHRHLPLILRLSFKNESVASDWFIEWFFSVLKRTLVYLKIWWHNHFYCTMYILKSVISLEILTFTFQQKKAPILRAVLWSVCCVVARVKSSHYERTKFIWWLLQIYTIVYIE